MGWFCFVLGDSTVLRSSTSILKGLLVETSAGPLPQIGPSGIKLMEFFI